MGKFWGEMKLKQIPAIFLAFFIVSTLHQLVGYVRKISPQPYHSTQKAHLSREPSNPVGMETDLPSHPGILRGQMVYWVHDSENQNHTRLNRQHYN